MPFNYRLLASVLLLSLSALSVTGCSLRMRESPPTGTSMGLSGADGACLTGASESFKEFFEGKSNGDKITKICDCAAESLNVFKTRTKGAQTGKYTSDELRDFLERYFLTDQKISDDLLRESMLLKTAFLGGDSLTLTIGELEQIIKLIGIAKTQLLRIRPFLPLTLKQMSDLTGRDDFVKDAGKMLIDVTRILGDALREKGSGYSLDRLDKLLLAIEPSYSGNEIRSVRERMPLIQAIKVLILGSSETMDWSKLLSSGARWYALALRVSHFQANYDSWNSGRGYELLTEITDDVRKLLLEASSSHPNGVIPWTEVENVIDGLRPDELSTGDFQVKPEALKKFGRHLMHLKTAVLTDGTPELQLEACLQGLSAADIEQAFQLVTVIRTQMNVLEPYFPLTLQQMQDKIDAGPEGILFANAAAAAVSRAGEAIAKTLGQNHFPYLLSDLDGLLGSLEEVLASDRFKTDRETVQSLRERMGFIGSVKNLIQGKQESLDWRRLVSSGARWYALALRGAYLQAKFPAWNSGPGSELLTELLDESQGLLQDAVAAHSEGMISQAEVESLIDGLKPEELKFADVQLRPQQLKKIVKQVLLLKYAVFGAGDTSRGVRANAKGFFASDIETIFRLIRVIRTQVSLLEPYFPLSLDHMKSLGRGAEARAFVLRAANQVLLSGDQIAEALNTVGPPYVWNHLDAILNSVEEVLQDSNEYKDLVEGVRSARKNLEVIKALKPILLAPPANGMHSADWSRLFHVGARWYALSLRWAYASENIGSWSSGTGHQWMVDLARDGQALLRDTIGYRSRMVIPFADFDRLIDAVHPDDLPLTPDTLKKLLRAVLQRAIAGATSGPQGRDAQGLTVGAIDRIWQGIRRWDAGQRFLEGAFRSATGSRKDDDLGDLEISLAALSSVPDRAVIGGGDAFVQAVAADLKEVSRKRPAFYHKNDDEILFAQTSTDMRSFRDLSELNWVRQVLQVVLQGYANDPARAAKSVGVTYAEFKQICDDIRQLGIELKLIDRERYDMHIKRFREANLFLFASDGDNLVSLEEGTQLFQYMLSAKKLSARMHNDVAEKCGKGPDDPFDYPTIDPECYRRTLFGRFDEFFGHMPGAVNHYYRLRGEARDQFENAFEEAGRLHGVTNLPADSTDSEGISMVAHYVEALLARFDTNASGTLDQNEANDAFSVFKDTFAEYVRPMGLDTDAKVKALFTYLLAKGKAPTKDNSGKASFVWWYLTGGEDFEADRSRILNIFTEVSKM